MSLTSDKLALFREIYSESIAHGGEISGLVSYTNSIWRLATIHYGGTDTVKVPDANIDLETFGKAKVVRYHTHIPTGGQICMPPSSDDWKTLNPDEKSLVITREGVYKFYMSRLFEDSTLKIDQSREIDTKLRKVHCGLASIHEYQSYVSSKGLRFEFYSFCSV